MSASREKHKRQDLKNSPDYKPSAEKQGMPKWARRLIQVGVIVVVVLAICWGMITSGILLPHIPALTVNGESVSVAEYNFNLYSNATNYVNYINQYYGQEVAGMMPDMTKSLKAQVVDELSGDTWADYFKEQTISGIRDVVTLAQKAKEAGLALDDADQKVIEEQVASLKAWASQSNKSPAQVLAASYGRGVNIAILRKTLERGMLADKYNAYYKENVDVSDSVLDAYYDENSGQVDDISFRMFGFAATSAALTANEGEPEPTQEEQDTADAIMYEYTRTRAEELMGKITSPSNFNQYAKEYAPEDSEADYDDPKTGLVENYTAKDLPAAMADWLYDNARENNELGIVEVKDSNGKVTHIYVVMLLGRERGDYETMNVRHLLVKFEESDDGFATVTDEQKEAAREKAQGYLNEYLAGEKTEDAFAALATAHSEDEGSQATGGLYENVARSVTVAPFEEWIYQSSRKPGDTDLVETEYGYHVMYFVSKGGVRWKLLAEENVRAAADEELTASVENDATVSSNGFGLFFVGTR